MNRINYNAGFGAQYAGGWSNKQTCVDAHVGAQFKGMNVEVKGGIDKNGNKNAELKFDKEF